MVDKPPAGPQSVHEIKWDGYRVSAYVADGNATIRTRNGHDWTARFPSIATTVAGLKVRSAVLDGEPVILDAQGRSSFAELQADLNKHGSTHAVLYAFDLLVLDGEYLRGKTLEERRLALGGIVPKRSSILFSEEMASRISRIVYLAGRPSFEGSGSSGSIAVHSACQIGFISQAFRLYCRRVVGSTWPRPHSGGL